MRNCKFSEMKRVSVRKHSNAVLEWDKHDLYDPSKLNSVTKIFSSHLSEKAIVTRCLQTRNDTSLARVTNVSVSLYMSLLTSVLATDKYVFTASNVVIFVRASR